MREGRRGGAAAGGRGRWSALFGTPARFAAVGLGATALHFAVLVAAVDGAGIAPAPANGLAFLVALGLSFVGQSLWVFRRPEASRIVRFVPAALVGLGVHAGLMALLVDGAGLPYAAGFAVCVLVVPPLSFVLARLWVFAPHVRLG